MTLANVHSFESFGSVDGPGVRFVVFLQGCKLRCKYCHNPDSWKMADNQLISAEDIVKKALSFQDYWGKDGGVTVSGGEPLLQIDFLIEFFKLLKTKKIHTTIDTSAGPFTLEEPFISKFNELMQYTDLVMLDLKHFYAKEHYALTKMDNTHILQCAKHLESLGKDVWIRHVLVPGYTDNEQHLKDLGAFIKSLSNVKKVEILPYHSFGKFKWDNLGLKYELDDVHTPSEEEVKRAKELMGLI